MILKLHCRKQQTCIGLLPVLLFQTDIALRHLRETFIGTFNHLLLAFVAGKYEHPELLPRVPIHPLSAMLAVNRLHDVCKLPVELLFPEYPK